MTKLPMQIQIGVSQCLMGDKVRFDAGHKREAFICNTLSQFFEFIAICPEVDIGLGVPRPPIRLIGDPKIPKLVSTNDESEDYTHIMKQYSQQKVTTLKSVSGYILKSKSPTCGLFRVKVYQDKGVPSKTSRGIYAKILAEKYPNLPIEEEGRLQDPMLRENFLERVYIYRRWQELIESGITKQKLINFHTIHKFTIMAHSPKLYQTLGKKVADLGVVNFKKFSSNYISELMYGLRNYRATRKKNTNVLQHIAGYLKNVLNKADKEELHCIFEDYHRGDIPLIVPITLLQHYFRNHPDDYILAQTYLNPYPGEFRLRNLL